MFEQLRALPMFAAYPDEVLAEVAKAVREQVCAQDEVIFREGDDQQGIYLLLEGEFEIRKRVRFQDVVISRHGPGSFVGEVALFTNSAQPATVITTLSSRFIVFDTGIFANFKDTPFALLITSMAERMRSMEAVVYQQDKLSALGKMAAGLAHELNNPASAARRASQHLPEYLVRLQKLALKFGGSGLTDSQVEGISAFYAALCGKPGEITEDALAISDREDALTTWLVQQGIAEGAEFAPMLARHSVTDDELERLRDLVGASQLLNVLAWVDGLFNLHVLIGTVDRGTARISDLIKAFKAYSYMDQAPEQEVDVHDGIESTLTIFAHRLKSVTLRREYDRTLPRITAYGGELNQVWTNLLDNALDAMGDAGTLTIRTGRDNEWLVVEVGDTGGGIPPEVQARIFEPFFTTKPLGQGTGLGLDIAYRIITERHHGHIEFNTSPAGTTFRVCLPIES